MARRRFRILLVDDEPDVLELLKETFAEDYEVLTAASGWTALDLLRAQVVDLLITDQRMPQITGVQLAERAHVDHPHLPIIILTAYTDPPDLIAAINKGQVYRFITKPWDVPHLLQTVEDALEAVRLRRENAQLLEAAQRRLDALNVMLDVLVAASATPSYTVLIDTVASLLEGVVPLNASATLLRADAARPPQLLMRLRTDIGEAALLALKDNVLEAFRAATNEPIPEETLHVALTGTRPRGAPGGELRSTLAVPLRVGGVVQGVLCVAAHDEDAFSRDDATMLDLIANRAADLVAGLRGKLDAERARMASVVEGMADGLVLTDAQGEVVVVNACAREMLRLEPAQASQRRALIEALTFDPGDLARGLGRGDVRTVAIDVAIGGRDVRAIVAPITDPRGRAGDIVTVLQDTTEERERDRRKEEFFADVSHELRTPLTAVAGALDLLLMKPEQLSESQRSYVALARSAASRLHSTIDDILDISRAARHGLELDVRVADLREIASDAVQRFEPSFQLGASRLDLVAPREPLMVRLDPARMGQVFNNLIGNALKYTPRGGRAVVEVFRRDDVGGAAGFSVRNDGPTIAAADRERIFLPYQRAAQGSGPRVKGTGLGLPLARTIVEAHHGRLWAEAEPTGALFVAVVPLDGPAPVLPSSDAFDPIAPEAKPRVGEAASVLVVDDDRLVGYALKGVLLAAGFQVELAHSADDALTIARRWHPRAFVVDVRMPDVDGAQLIEILRHDPDTREAVIVAVSSPEQAARAKKAGADGFLEKPLVGGRLVATLAQLTHARAGAARVLVVSDDAEVVEACTSALAPLGYAVQKAADEMHAQELLVSLRPDLTILDLKLAEGAAFSLLDDLVHTGGSRAAVVCLASPTDTRGKVRALQSGADDCFAFPFEPLELRARAENLLRRREDQSASGGSSLPGSAAIDREVQARLASRTQFTLCYFDLDNFKAFNDTYGYARADGVVAQTGDLLRGVVQEHGGSDDFVGHIAGDDFVLITAPERASAIARAVMIAFDRLVPLYYSKDDRERGYIEADDRFGQKRRFPIMGISIVGVTDPGGRFKAHGELAAVAAGLKKDAKAIAGSVFVFDDGATRRTEPPTP